MNDDPINPNDSIYEEATLMMQTDTPPLDVAASPGNERHQADANVDELREKIIEVLRTVHDPEIPVNIYELGLIYLIDVDPKGVAHIKMTLTAPNCPAAGSLPGEVQTKVKSVPGVTDADVVVVWEPTWEQSMMSEAAKLQLGLF